MCYALFLVGDALGFIRIGGQEVFQLRVRLALEGKFHMLIFAFYCSHYVHLVHYLIESGLREVGNGGVPCHLHLQLSDRQLMIIEQHNQFACIRIIHLAVDVLRSVPADEVCLAGCYRPELDAKGRCPACIAVYGQHEV